MKYYIKKKPGKFVIIFLTILVTLYLISLLFYKSENKIFNIIQIVYLSAFVIYQFISSTKYYVSFDENNFKFRLFRIKERTIQFSEITRIDVKLFEIIITLKNDEEISIDLNETDDKTLKKIKNKFNLISENLLRREYSINIQANN